MAVASSSTTNAPAESPVLGVCLLAKLPEVELRAALARGGYSPAFWHESVDSTIETCLERDLDLLLLGVRRPDSQALECVGASIEADASTQVILICERSGAGDARKALDAGARALVPLGEVGQALAPVIGAVRAGQVSVPSSVGSEASRGILTTREKQILGQVVLGMTNAEIATKLFLAESTIKSHLSSAFAKLGVTSRNEAVSLILNPASGAGLGILTIPSQKIAASVK